MGLDLFSPVPLEPEMTPEERADLEALASEAVMMQAMTSILDDECPWTATGRRKSSRVEMSDRKYYVAKDGSFRRMRDG